MNSQESIRTPVCIDIVYVKRSFKPENYFPGGDEVI